MAQNLAQNAFTPEKDALIPGLIGNFNIPKAVIENKIDVLAFLEIMVRKGIVTAQELDEIRAAVVAHLNVIYPELELKYATPESMGQQAGLGGSALPPPPPAKQAPSFTAPASYTPPAPAAQMTSPPKAESTFQVNADDKAVEQMPEIKQPNEQPAAARPLWVQAPPPKFIK